MPHYDLARLCQAIYRARLVLRKPRQNRLEMVRQYVGQHWSEEGTSERVPVNQISLYCQIVGRSLIAKNPRVLLSTFNSAAKPTVSAMQDWCNEAIEEMDLASTLQRVVLDALFSVGIAKVALATPVDAARTGWDLAGGEPFVERVDLDDFVFDVHARDFAEVTFIGHRFRAPLDAVKSGKYFSKGRRELEPDWDEPFNKEGDERINMLGQTFMAGYVEEFVPHVTLWEVYLPHERVVLTLHDNWMQGAKGDEYVKPLREQDWLGPDTGPYHLLGYSWVPGNPMPKGPIQDLYDLHDATNRLYRKLIRQAERQKSNTLYPRSAAEDATKVKDADDGEMVAVDQPDKIIEVSRGGPNQQNFVMADHLFQRFMLMAGNLEAAGGLAPQAKTLGQDELLQKAATAGVADMQDRTVRYTACVLKALCWYWHHHPQRVMRTRYQVPGLPDVGITRHVTPAQRQQVAWEDLQLMVDPYSMQSATPASRVQGIFSVLQQIAPFMPFVQQQGIIPDMKALLEMLGKYLDLPELGEILDIQEPQQDEGDIQTPDGTGKPANTTRRYERVSGSNRSQQNQHQELIQAMKGGMGPQQNGMVNR